MSSGHSAAPGRPQRDGRAADAWPHTVHRRRDRPCTVWRGARRDSRAAQAGGCAARRPHGELAARQRKQWRRGSIRDLSPNSATAGTAASLASSRAAAERGKEFNPRLNLNASVVRVEQDRQPHLADPIGAIGWTAAAVAPRTMSSVPLKSLRRGDFSGA